MSRRPAAVTAADRALPALSPRPRVPCPPAPTRRSAGGADSASIPGRRYLVQNNPSGACTALCVDVTSYDAWVRPEPHSYGRNSAPR